MKKIILFFVFICLISCSAKQKKGSLVIFADGSIEAQYDTVKIEYDSNIEAFYVYVCEDPNCE